MPVTTPQDSPSLRGSTPLHVDGLTDMGNRRLNNEDAWCAGQLGGAFASMDQRAASLLPLDPHRGPVVAIVSDGIGGANAGEVASQIAVSALCQALVAMRDRLAVPEAVRDAILDAVRSADDAIKQKAGEPEFANMGATLSALVFTGTDQVWWVQVGDSRIYRYHDRCLTQISRDQSPVGRMRQGGQITEAEARRHPLRNQIDQSCGDTKNPLHPDIESSPVASGDVFLICSDGLSDGLWDGEIDEILGKLKQPSDVRPVVSELIERSKGQSGRDNLTAVVCFAARSADDDSIQGTSFGRHFLRWMVRRRQKS